MRRERAAIAFVFLIVLATHVAYQYLSQGDYFFPDSFTYLAPTLGMLHGLGFASDPDDPETLRTPGYPVFLMPFLAMKAKPGAIVFVQHLLYALLAVAVYLLARRYGAARFASVTGALVLALDTITIHYSNKILTETLSAILIFAVVVLLMYRRTTLWLVAIGLLCGALVLVRPVAIAWFGVLALWLVWMRARPIAVIAFIVASIALPVAWASRNAARTGVFTISSIGAINMLSYRAAAALAIEDGGDFRTQLTKRQKQLDAIVAGQVKAGEGVESVDEISSADLSRYHGPLARSILLHHPWGAALMTMRGFVVNMIDTDWDALAEVVDDDLIPEEATEIAVHAWTWMLWIAAIFGLVQLWRRNSAAAALVAATIFYFIFMAAGGEAEARFRAPIVPLMAVAAAFVILSRADGEESGRGRDSPAQILRALRRSE
ncbi:MAG TPA: hypothetical protein VF980_16005 [Thermoanaerobaculia bacterium]